MSTQQPNALSIQVGGGHYKDLKIQPVEYIHANNLPFIEGSVVKYITRWRSKGGLKDLEKVKHFVDLLIELEGIDKSTGMAAAMQQAAPAGKLFYPDGCRG